MTPKEFRSLALALPETSEGSHRDHPDFRVGGKIFATLGQAEDWGMVKLTPDKQAELIDTDPDAYLSFGGDWGRRGCTKVVLAAAAEAPVRDAILEAWRNIAPKKLVQEYDDQNS